MIKTNLHLWTLSFPESTAPESLYSLLPLLSENERKRFASMGSRERQVEFILSHAMARIKIAGALNAPPLDLPIVFGEGKRPSLEGGLNKYFTSLSHSANFIACTLSEFPVGVDVETIRKRPDDDRVPVSYFAKEELTGLDKFSGREKWKRFYELWALKEAFFKASGLKFGDIVKRTIFEIGPAGKVDSNMSGWRFTLSCPGANLVMALAMETSEDILPAHASVDINDLLSFSRSFRSNSWL